MIMQVVTIVRKPICPTLVHNDSLRLIICGVGIVVCSYILYRFMKYFS
jgi:hypothetical protein